MSNIFRSFTILRTKQRLSGKSIMQLSALALALMLPALPMQADNLFDTLASRLSGASTSLDAASESVKGQQAAVRAEVAPEDPEIEMEYLWPHDRGEKNRWSLGVSQKLPDFRRRAAAGRVVAALDSAGSAQRQALSADNLWEARKKLIEYIGVYKEHIILHEIHQNFDSLSTAYERAWKRGESTLLDLNKIRIEHAQAYSADFEVDGRMEALEQEIIALSRGAISADELRQLTEYPYFHITPTASSFPKGHLVDPSGECAHPEDEAESALNVDQETLDKAIKQSPQYLSMLAARRAAQAQVELAGKSRFPSLSLGYVHAFEDGRHFNGISAGLTLPVWSRSAEKSSAVADLLALEAENSTAFAELTASVKSDLLKASALKQRLDMFGPAIVCADNLRLLRMALKGGEITLLNYLQEISYFSQATLEYNSVKLEYALTMASLLRYFPSLK